MRTIYCPRCLRTGAKIVWIGGVDCHVCQKCDHTWNDYEVASDTRKRVEKYKGQLIQDGVIGNTMDC